ncbi:MAG: heme NO-binding domain-containing protein [Rhodomicrobiaceae bacterium]
MKGIIFTEFLDFIEAEHGYETVDAILQRAAPPSNGAYTAVGNYSFSEMAALTSELAKLHGKAEQSILRAFGRHLFGQYYKIYPLFFQDYTDPLDFLQSIEGKIHTEVLKLYPDARLPHMKTERIGQDEVVLSYRSDRPLGELCLGIIEGCGVHFGVELLVEAKPVSDGLDIHIRRVDPRTPRAATEIEAVQ